MQICCPEFNESDGNTGKRVCRYRKQLLVVRRCATSGLSGCTCAPLDTFLRSLAEACLSKRSVKSALKCLNHLTHTPRCISMGRLYDFMNVTVRYPYPSITTIFDIVLPKRPTVAQRYLWAWFVCPALV